jgi:hypothetical protein
MRPILRSTITNSFFVKVWGPLLCILGASVAFNRDFPFRSLFLTFPFLIVFFFGLSVAIVEIRDGIFCYRRLFKWRAIDRNEVVNARVEAPPVLGSVRLNRFLFPWGRLYFVLDKNINFNLFGEGKYPLLDYIRDNKEPNRG